MARCGGGVDGDKDEEGSKRCGGGDARRKKKIGEKRTDENAPSSLQKRKGEKGKQKRGKAFLIMNEIQNDAKNSNIFEILKFQVVSWEQVVVYRDVKASNVGLARGSSRRRVGAGPSTPPLA